MSIAVGCSSGRRFYIGKEGIGIAIDHKFSVSNGCITVDSPLDLILRSTEYGKRLKIKDAYGASADVAYDPRTGAATTNWSYGAGVHVTNPWHGCVVSGGLSFSGDNAALTCVDYYDFDNDWKLSVRECAKMAKAIAEGIEVRFGAPMTLRGLDSEETLIAEAEKPFEEQDSHGERDFLRYCGKNGEGDSANEYVVVGHVNSNRQCRISFAYAVAGELCRCYAPTESDRKWEEACAYRDGTHGWKKDPAKSRALFLEAGEQHVKGTHFVDRWRVEWIGECYGMGRDPFPHDDEKALEWYRRAAGMGSLKCMRKIASCYRDGKGVAKDVAQAESWLRKADEEEWTYVPLEGEHSGPRSGKVGSFADLKLGTTDAFAKNRQFLRSSCHTEWEWWGDGLEKVWSHTMSVRLAQHFHGFDMADLSFDAPNMELASCELCCSETPPALSEEECRNEVVAIAEELEKRMGVEVTKQALVDKEDAGIGHVIASYRGIAGKGKTKAQYSLAGIRDAKGRCQICLFVSRSAWRVFSDTGSSTECTWERK